MGFLSILGWPERIAIAVGILVAIVTGALLTLHVHDTRVFKQGYDKAVAEVTVKKNKELTERLAEEHRKTDAVQGSANEARNQLQAARVALTDTVRAGERLRQQLSAAYAVRRPAAQPAAAGRSAPADPTGDLLADVQRRLEEAENGTVRFADEGRIAGNACERAYQALTPP